MSLGVQSGTKKGIALAQLGQMLQYPGLLASNSASASPNSSADYFATIHRLVASVSTAYPANSCAAAKHLAKFESACKNLSLGEMEELYTRTFDLAALCSLYVTGYIFGDENFDRGTVMAKLSDRFSELGYDTAGELPDHLAVLLRFASWLDDEALNELVVFCLLEPVSEMIKQLNKDDNPYFYLLSAVHAVSKVDRVGG